jgi:hypothetical protein
VGVNIIIMESSQVNVVCAGYLTADVIPALWVDWCLD